MKIGIWILLCLFQSYVSTRKYQNDFEELVNILTERSHDDSTAEDVNPTDRVNVALWNQLNQDDIEDMPEIDDYSSEKTATKWLKWYSRVSLRYSQVNTSENSF
jgi:hypothetical protein